MRFCSCLPSRALRFPGAVWANEAWGSYWSWDPKETWALITWLVYSFYLHTRLNKGWKGVRLSPNVPDVESLSKGGNRHLRDWENETSDASFLSAFSNFFLI